MKTTKIIFTFTLYAMMLLHHADAKEYCVTEEVYNCLQNISHSWDNDVEFKQADKSCKAVKKVEVSPDDYERITKATCYKDNDDIKNGLRVLSTGNSIEMDTSLPVYKAMISKYVDPGKLCVTDLRKQTSDTSDECAYISKEYGICDTHAYNAGYDKNPDDSSKLDHIREIVGLKVTVISQQMYKQYEYLNATLKRLKTQLQKSVLNAKLEMAGAKSESSGGSSGGGYKTYLAGADNCTNKMNKNAAYPCIQNNLNLIINATDTNVNQARKQLADTLEAAEAWEITDKGHPAPDACKSTSKADIKKCAQLMNVKVSNKIDELKNRSNGQIIQLGLQSNQ